jgi:hypothetical protein
VLGMLMVSFITWLKENFCETHMRRTKCVLGSLLKYNPVYMVHYDKW